MQVLFLCVLSTLVFEGNAAEDSNCADRIDDDFWQKQFLLNKKRFETHAFASDGVSFAKKRAKNVIAFIGDGMGISTITASRIFNGQRLDKTKDLKNVECGADYQFDFEKRMPYMGLQKTYNLDRQTPDSASTASAMFDGHKTGHFSLNDGHDCDHKHETILEYAKRLGKRTGLVTTTHLMHATPAATYACIDVRWKYAEVAKQFLNAVKNGTIDVALGGGSDVKFEITDKNLTDLGATPVKATQVQNDAVPKGKLPLVGLFSPESMPYIDQRDRATQPNLEEMTQFAVHALSENNDNGFFLLVEAGRIDQAHHANLAQRALLETAEFDRSFKNAYDELVKMDQLDDTLMVLTADHSHQFVLGSYSDIGTSLFDFLKEEDWKKNEYSRSMYPTLPWLPVTYVTGPGGNWTDLLKERNDTHQLDYSLPSFIQTKTAHHAGEDVAIFARGPQGHLASGVHEQTDMFHMMKAAFDFEEKVGKASTAKVSPPDLTLCKSKPATKSLADTEESLTRRVLFGIIIFQTVVIAISFIALYLADSRVTRLQKLQNHSDTELLETKS